MVSRVRMTSLCLVLMGHFLSGMPLNKIPSGQETKISRAESRGISAVLRAIRLTGPARWAFRGDEPSYDIADQGRHHPREHGEQEEAQAQVGRVQAESLAQSSEQPGHAPVIEGTLEFAYGHDILPGRQPPGHNLNGGSLADDAAQGRRAGEES